MFGYRKFKFHHGKEKGDKVAYTPQTYRFTQNMLILCAESNSVDGVKAELICVKENIYGDWSIVLRVNQRRYFHVIVSKFIETFNDVITEVEF